MIDEDNRVKSAMDDGDLVVQVLLTLYQPSPLPLQLKSPPLAWSITKKLSIAKENPTTPLSWSGVISVTDGGGSGGGNGLSIGIEEFSPRPDFLLMMMAPRSPMPLDDPIFF
ncbi:hypothetical protein L6452_03140 [Arctium lappa]|uniref:Uncharacterized protein n=1 Tax=Arctium lappa TaxID=4217 RepID=A0ACB9FLI5_ARCLA|nr:hypothetical protein L6452_03140 [Arctium lappa]